MMKRLSNQNKAVSITMEAMKNTGSRKKNVIVHAKVLPNLKI